MHYMTLAESLASTHQVPVAPLQLWQTKHGSRHCQLSSGGQRLTWLRTLDGQGSCTEHLYVGGST